MYTKTQGNFIISLLIFFLSYFSQILSFYSFFSLIFLIFSNWPSQKRVKKSFLYEKIFDICIKRPDFQTVFFQLLQEKIEKRTKKRKWILKCMENIFRVSRRSYTIYLVLYCSYKLFFWENIHIRQIERERNRKIPKFSLVWFFFLSETQKLINFYALFYKLDKT